MAFSRLPRYCGCRLSLYIILMFLTALLLLHKYNVNYYSEVSDNNRLRVLLVSHEGAEPSFTGEVLQHLPNTYFLSEPGNSLNQSKEEYFETLYKVFKCQQSSIKGILDLAKENPIYTKLQQNVKYLKQCTALEALVPMACLWKAFCKRHNIILMKSDGLKSTEAVELIKKFSDINLKIIYLTRDPRTILGTQHNYLVSKWCKLNAKCLLHDVLCPILHEDLRMACVLSHDKPNDFMLLRYEDLIRNPVVFFSHISNFLGFESIPEEINIFLKSRKKTLETMKENIAVLWKDILFEDITKIQNKCNRVLKGLGYQLYSHKTSMSYNSSYQVDLYTAFTPFCINELLEKYKEYFH